MEGSDRTLESIGSRIRNALWAHTQMVQDYSSSIRRRKISFRCVILHRAPNFKYLVPVLPVLPVSTSEKKPLFVTPKASCFPIPFPSLPCPRKPNSHKLPDPPLSPSQHFPPPSPLFQSTALSSECWYVLSIDESLGRHFICRVRRF